jgi:hypothetical protein
MIAPELEIIFRRLICRLCAPAAMRVQVVAELVVEGAEERAEEGNLARFEQAPRWPGGPM